MPTGLAHIEHAWPRGRPELAGRYPELLLVRTDRPGAEHYRAELLRLWVPRTVSRSLISA